MKDYNEIASELFERRDEYVKERKRKTKRAVTAGVSALCAAAVVIGVGVWKTAGKSKPQIVDAVYSEITAPEADGKKIRVITSYPYDGEPCYATPENGTFFCSMEVDGALKNLKESGEDTALLVHLEVFRNRESAVDGDELMNEYKRLSELGYKFYTVTVYEYEGEEQKQVYRDVTALLITPQQIEDFTADTEYGYFFDFIHNGDWLEPVSMDNAKPLTF